MLKRIERDQPDTDAAERRHRVREAIALQEIEGNPLNAEQIAMFEMFEREGWSDEQALTHLAERHRRPA